MVALCPPDEVLPSVPWRLMEYPESLNRARLGKGIDRCQSKGTTYDLADLVEDGVILDPTTEKPLTTPALGAPGVWIFAVRDGRMRLAADGGSRSVSPLHPEAVKHETLFHNQSVTAAGEICISEGTLVDLNQVSGTYAVALDDDFKGSVVEAVEAAEASLDPALRRRLQ